MARRLLVKPAVFSRLAAHPLARLAIHSRWERGCGLAILLMLPLALVAAGAAQSQELKLTPKQGADVAEQAALHEKRARDAVQGYYDALIRGEYDQAGTFTHPDAIEPVRAQLVDAIQKASPAQQASTLQNLGVGDMSVLQSMTTAQFFAAYVRSTYGKGLQLLAKPERKASIEIKAVKCLPDRPACDVTYDIKQLLEGRPVAGTNQVRAALVQGRWLVGEIALGRSPQAPPR